MSAQARVATAVCKSLCDAPTLETTHNCEIMRQRSPLAAKPTPKARLPGIAVMLMLLAATVLQSRTTVSCQSRLDRSKRGALRARDRS